MNKIAAFDIDGVLAEFENHLVKTLSRKFGSDAYINRHLFSLEGRFAKHTEIRQKALGLTSDPNFYYGIPCNEHASRFVFDLADEGYSILYVTSRPSSHETFTRRWLQKYALYEKSLGLFCGVENKAKFLSEYDIDLAFLVEDNPEEVTRCLKIGVPVLCWSQDWNGDVFPRLYVTGSGVLMLWADEDRESVPFWYAIKEAV